MNIYNLNAYKNAQQFIKDVPEIIAKLDNCYNILSKWKQFPPIFKVCKELVVAKSLMEYNLDIAKKAIKVKGEYEEEK